jgi:hypothetical protein
MSRGCWAAVSVSVSCTVEGGQCQRGSAPAIRTLQLVESVDIFKISCDGYWACIYRIPASSVVPAFFVVSLGPALNCSTRRQLHC